MVVVTIGTAAGSPLRNHLQRPTNTGCTCAVSQLHLLNLDYGSLWSNHNEYDVAGRPVGHSCRWRYRAPCGGQNRRLHYEAALGTGCHRVNLVVCCQNYSLILAGVCALLPQRRS